MNIEIGKSIDHKFDVDCRQCHRTTKHIVLASVDASGQEPMGPDDCFHWNALHQIVQCQGCEAIAFRRMATDSESFVQVGADEYEQAESIDIFPNPNEGRTQIEDAYLLPEHTGRIYGETMKALNAGQAVLCGIGVRALIETVCKDKKANGKDLFSQINDLVGQGGLLPVSQTPP